MTRNNRFCCNCFYYMPTTELHGECRYYPPKPDVSTKVRPIGETAIWPIVKQSDWCGKYE